MGRCPTPPATREDRYVILLNYYDFRDLVQACFDFLGYEALLKSSSLQGFTLQKKNMFIMPHNM